MTEGERVGPTVPDASPGPAGESDHRPLPEPVRGRVLVLAADALGALGPDEVPPSLRPFARFAPAKRARLAATPIASALETDAVFRGRVAERVRGRLPALAEALDAGEAPSAADPVEVAAVAYLLRPAGWTRLVAAAAEESERQAAREEATQAAEAVARLEQQLADARSSRHEEVDRLRSEIRDARGEAHDLRRRLKETRDRLRAAETAERAALAAVEEARATSAQAQAAADAELRRLRARLTDAEAELEAARRAAREGRSVGDARMRLLLDTVVQAAQGLRRELALPPVTTRPADTVGAVTPVASGPDDVAERALASDDPALLDQLLGLPQVHLVVDGYNVTKSGYGGQTLEAQRARLLSGMAVLAAQTRAEVTVVFDGADLAGPVPVVSPRGVRVRFSPPGVTADEVIRRLVRAEPEGRPLVVVSDDKEVADGVRRAGARPVRTALLLRWLQRG